MKLPVNIFITAILILFLGSGFIAQENRQKVLIKTPKGNIVVALYEETPKHTQNFIELAKKGYYDSLLFHRVISGFMIQGGDPASKNAKPGQALGNSNPNYTIPPEFVDTLIHKRGALAAARKGDNINPKKESSGSQFYLVQGQKFEAENLRKMDEQRINQMYSNEITKFLRNPENDSLLQHYKFLTETKKYDEARDFWETLKPKVAEKVEPFRLSNEQIEIYSREGGAPHLDGGYTVFGEMISGFEVLDEIAGMSTDDNDRPEEDIWMIVEYIGRD